MLGAVVVVVGSEEKAVGVTSFVHDNHAAFGSGAVGDLRNGNAAGDLVEDLGARGGPEVGPGNEAGGLEGLGTRSEDLVRVVRDNDVGVQEEDVLEGRGDHGKELPLEAVELGRSRFLARQMSST